ncbi:hypothetical protein DMN91_012115 [Ooceraea biroi]|uniref:t-SNARE coiled-coil homology domain-containing protein n=1 Tax=Ooceraea biroi TaxID=2015173 RepID=A0A026W673_OOCBI|nr:uncharacterized protein LOC105283657 [Ooceraea biroi]XP_026829840.1 uncharacterized protein LOC113563044 [Ooceraea biroi]EZA50544.1 hypothetical protein X777_11131 [Ooceraea biroi]RLU15927.1 hypothetical protein DMN91_011684 [Ooceraea biroi]RLU16355.1 hypothetical protein DMN91_012115 [Ooceraea biroi]
MSLDMDSLIRTQNDILNRILRAYDNLKKIGTSKLTQGIVEARLQALEANWAKFDSNHESLLTFPSETLASLDYTSQDIPAQAEEAYLQQKGKFLDVQRTLRAMDVSTSFMPASSATTASAPSSSASRITLPQIQLPQFSGKYEDWPAFRDLFLSIIG